MSTDSLIVVEKPLAYSIKMLDEVANLSVSENWKSVMSKFARGFLNTSMLLILLLMLDINGHASPLCVDKLKVANAKTFEFSQKQIEERKMLLDTAFSNQKNAQKIVDILVELNQNPTDSP